MRKISAIAYCSLLFLCGFKDIPALARGRRVINIYGHTLVKYPAGKAWAVKYDFNWMQYNLWPTGSPIDDIYSNDLGNPLPKCQSIYYNFSGIHGGDFIATYDKADRLISYTNTSLKSDTLTGFTKYLFSYDFPGRLSKIHELKWSAGSSTDTIAIKQLFYNNQNQLLRDSSIYLNKNIVTRTRVHYYSYDSREKLIEIELKDSSVNGILKNLYRQSYDDSGRQISFSCFVNGSPSYTDSFGYTGNLPYFTSYRSYSYSSGSPKIGAIYSKHVGTNGLPDTYTREIPGVIKSIDSYDYDSLGNVIMIHEKEYNERGELTNDHSWSYYYEDMPDSIRSAAPHTEIAAYPNPVKDELTVAWRNGTKDGDYTIQLYNLMGQRLLTKTIRWNGQLEALSLACLPNGNYLITVEGGAPYKRFVQKILKL